MRLVPDVLVYLVDYLVNKNTVVILKNNTSVYLINSIMNQKCHLKVRDESDDENSDLIRTDLSKNYIVCMNLSTNDINIFKKQFETNSVPDFMKPGGTITPIPYNNQCMVGPFVTSDKATEDRTAMVKQLNKKTERKKHNKRNKSKTKQNMRPLNILSKITHIRDKSIVPDLQVTNPRIKRIISKMMPDCHENSDTGDDWPTSSPYWCWYCRHDFNTPPVGIPDKYDNNAYHLYGNFCSYNCALTYLSYGSDPRVDKCDGDTLYERKQLLFMMCSEINNGMDITEQTIKEVPPLHFLNKSGGIQTIEELREGCYTNCNYKVFKPPLIPIYFHLEISGKSNTDKPRGDIILNKVKIEQATQLFQEKKIKQKLDNNAIDKYLSK